MKTEQRFRIALIVALALLCALGAEDSTGQPGCIDPTILQARPIYMINPGPVGSCTDCDQDYDGDLVEYLAFLDEHDLTGQVQGIVGDMFPGCSGNEIAHGEIVEEYFRGFGPGAAEVHMDEGVAELVYDMIAVMGGDGAVGNLSVSDGPGSYDPVRMEAFEVAFDEGLLLVGVVPAFGPPQEQAVIGDKNIKIYKSAQSAPSGGLGSGAVNQCSMYFAAMWEEAGGNNIVVKPGNAFSGGQNNPAYDFMAGGYTDAGSFITPMAAGSMAHVMAVVEARGLTGGDLVGQTIDCIVSACDHPDDSFALHSSTLASYAPWSQNWHYGFFNPWKALLYACGFGRINSQDNDLYGIDNPVTAFNDHFELRGDLLVEEGQHLYVGPMASVAIVTAVPEGPEYGLDPNLHEIRVDGEMTIAGEVIVSMVIGSDGVVTVEETGTLNIAEGQDLRIEDGGTLIINGTIILDGEFFIDGGTLTLNSDLDISATGRLIAYNGAAITVGDVDLMAGGADTAEVEINSAGVLVLSGQPGNPIVVQSENPGTDDWAGISLNSSLTDWSFLYHATISDAAVGLELSGVMPTYLNTITFSDDDYGLRIIGRDIDNVLACTFSGADVGIVVENADPTISQCEIGNNDIGIRCVDGAKPKLRDSLVSSNGVGIQILGPNTYPDLGTVADPGNNQLLAPGKNQKYIVMSDVAYNILAQQNWWGTTDDAAIEAKIVVFGSTAEVIFLPKLMAPPTAGDPELPDIAMDDDVDKSKDTTAVTRMAFMPNRVDRSGTGVMFSFRTPAAGHVEMSVFDLRGRRVRSLVQEFMSQGEHKVTWDGRDSGGRRPASGVYLVRLVGHRQVATTKVLIRR